MRYLNISPEYIGVYFTETKAIADGHNDPERQAIAIPFKGSDAEMEILFPNRDIEFFE